MTMDTISSFLAHLPSSFTWPKETFVLTAVALLLSSLGFLRVVYFVSLGYGFSIAAMALLSLGWFFARLDVLGVLHLIGLALYGLRLGGYLVARERQPSYRDAKADVQQRGAGIGAAKKVAIWLGVSFLYVAMFSPGLYVAAALRDGTVGWAARLVGVILLYGGLLLESLADRQKSAFKAQNPKRFCDVGLYRIVRCPNYLGEIVVWVGSWVAGVAAYGHVGQWILSLFGLGCIVLIMMGSTKRLEHTQDARYGEDPVYKEYVRSVPVLFPFIPVYSLRNVKVYLE